MNTFIFVVTSSSDLWFHSKALTLGDIRRYVWNEAMHIYQITVLQKVIQHKAAKLCFAVLWLKFQDSFNRWLQPTSQLNVAGQSGQICAALHL